ncbi:MAG: DUF2911 domain-containing protein [Gemmatimonadota bacterium]
MRSHIALRSLAAGVVLFAAAPVSAQHASLVYRLGKDTLAIEQYTRTATRLNGEMVQRVGAAVVRVLYDVTLGSDGRPTAATIRRVQADGSPLPNAPAETRIQVTADSVIREIAWADSVQRRAFAASKALVNFPTFVYGPTELLAGLRRAGAAADSLPALGAGGNLGFTGFSPAGGDSVRLRGGAYPMVLRFDANGRLLSVDGSATTNKAMAVRGPGGIDLAAVARTMKPTGVLSPREVARGAFGPGGMVLIDHGRPQVRERTVWGGTLVPFDSVWRAGANDATHLFTTRTLTMGTLTMGTLTVPAGMYTLWVQHTRDGTFLIINKQTGQWGTQYDAAQDLGRVPMQLVATPAHVEEFTVAVRAMGGNRGVIEMAWGPSVASVPFTVSVGRP